MSQYNRVFNSQILQQDDIYYFSFSTLESSNLMSEEDIMNQDLRQFQGIPARPNQLLGMMNKSIDKCNSSLHQMTLKLIKIEKKSTTINEQTSKKCLELQFQNQMVKNRNKDLEVQQRKSKQQNAELSMKIDELQLQNSQLNIWNSRLASQNKSLAQQNKFLNQQKVIRQEERVKILIQNKIVHKKNKQLIGENQSHLTRIKMLQTALKYANMSLPISKMSMLSDRPQNVKIQGVPFIKSIVGSYQDSSHEKSEEHSQK